MLKLRMPNVRITRELRWSPLSRQKMGFLKMKNYTSPLGYWGQVLSREDLRQLIERLFLPLADRIGWTPYIAVISAAVRSHLIVSRATRALKPTSYRFPMPRNSKPPSDPQAGFPIKVGFSTLTACPVFGVHYVTRPFPPHRHPEPSYAPD